MTETTHGKDESNSSGADSPLVLDPFSICYMFTLHLHLRLKQIGQTPTGEVLDVQLVSGTAKIDQALYRTSWNLDFKPERLTSSYAGRPESKDPFWFGIMGDVINWNDWVLIRSDNVSEFNGRATIKTGDGCLIGVVFSGCLDRDGVTDGKRHVQLAIRFEGGQKPPEWADDQYQPQQTQWKYQRLFRDLFVARGVLSVGDHNAESGRFHVWGPSMGPFHMAVDEEESLTESSP
jgi:hypothetical protein